jgi:hypothetical protein
LPILIVQVLIVFNNKLPLIADLNCSFSIFQESCARTLLFRGADKDALNYAGQTPYQVAVIAANLELADVIQNHRPEDVGKSIILSSMDLSPKVILAIVFVLGAISYEENFLAFSNQCLPEITHVLYTSKF